MSGHPLQRYARVLEAAGARRLADLTQSEADCAVGGIVTGLRPLKTRRGDRMAVFTLEDEAAKVEVVVFPETFARHGALVADDAMLLVRGKFERDDESSRLVASDITPVDLVRERAIREVEIRLPGHGLGKDAMHRLERVFERHAGDRRLAFVVETNGGAGGLRVRTATARRIKPSDVFVREVEAICGAGTVVMK